MMTSTLSSFLQEPRRGPPAARPDAGRCHAGDGPATEAGRQGQGEGPAGQAHRRAEEGAHAAAEPGKRADGRHEYEIPFVF